MKTIFKGACKYLSRRTTKQVGSMAISLAFATKIYQHFSNSVVCQDSSISADQSANNQIEIISDDQSNVEIATITRYSQISDLIIHHRTASECIILLPGCSEETQQLLLGGLQEKSKKKQIKVIKFDPSQKQVNTSSKEEKRELEKTKELRDKLQGQEFFGINSAGDLKFFNWKGLPSAPQFQKAMNFFTPPKAIQENEFAQLVQQLTDLREEEKIIITYIPEEKVYEANLPKISTFDLYRQGRIKNVGELEQRFREVSYEFVEQNTTFIIVRNYDVAQSLSIGKDDIGDIFIIKKSQQYMSNESNWVFANKQYLHNRIEWDPNTDSSLILSTQQIIQKLYQRSLNYVNAIHVEADLRHFLIQAEELGLKKFLIYYSAEALEVDYENNLMKKLISLKKNTTDQEFVILFTKNPHLLKKYFKIIPEKFIDTVRLLNFNKSEIPTQKPHQFQNWQVIYKDPYHEEQSSAPEKQPNQQTNDKQESIPQLNDTTIYETESKNALRYKYEGKSTRNKLTGFVKKCISQENEIYNESESLPALQKTLYLNSANFSQKILKDQSEDITIVYFFKPDCPNCAAMSKALNKFSEDLSIIQKETGQFENGSKVYSRHEDSLINTYRLENYEVFKRVKVYRYNIYNECPDFPSPSAAPLLLIFTQDNRLKPIQADLLKDRVHINESEKVSRYLFKKIELLNL